MQSRRGWLKEDKPAESAEVPQKWPKVPQCRSSALPRKTSQNLDQALQDTTPVSFQGVDDDEDQDIGVQSHEEEDETPIQRQPLLPYPRVYQSIQLDHPVDNILGSIRRRVTTHSRLV